MSKNNFIGIDLFSGAGGMSVGAIASGVDVKVAIEKDNFAAATYKLNHPNTDLYNVDIREVSLSHFFSDKKKISKVLFGGPPCQGFSTSNQKTRDKTNPNNWLFKEYLRIVKETNSDWVIVENVKGIVETEKGFFLEEIIIGLEKLGYSVTYKVLNAADFGVPQFRNRLFIVGSKHGIKYEFPISTVNKYLTVSDAISDLPILYNGANYEELEYRTTPQNLYQKESRYQSKSAFNNHVSLNNSLVINRYKHIPQGGNWQAIPIELMNNYKDFSRCHTGIYRRLKSDEPSVVIGNYRKNMLIHPVEDRGLSVREAARIQSFPDTYKFTGGIGFQQQQVGNSVPPLLAKAIFKQILESSK